MMDHLCLDPECNCDDRLESLSTALAAAEADNEELTSRVGDVEAIVMDLRLELRGIGCDVEGVWIRFNFGTGTMHMIPVEDSPTLAALLAEEDVKQ